MEKCTCAQLPQLVQKSMRDDEKVLVHGYTHTSACRTRQEKRVDARL